MIESQRNRRTRRQDDLVAAPADPAPFDDSPHPPAATTTSVRPPKASSPPSAKSRLARTAQLIVGVVVVLASSIGVAWGARRYLLSSPRFAVRTVLVDGVARRTAEQVARVAGVGVGKNIFALDLENAKASILTDPWILSATVTRQLPATVRITVAEREARAIVALGGELYLSSADGELFKKLADDDPSDLPIVTGLLPESVAQDRIGASLTIKRALDVVSELERVGVAKRYPLQELHIERDGAIEVTVGREAIALHLGHGPFRGKVEQGARVLREIAQRKANASVIFLDNDAHPERVVVRMR